jgi:hypothetical protein
VLDRGIDQVLDLVVDRLRAFGTCGGLFIAHPSPSGGRTETKPIWSLSPNPPTMFRAGGLIVTRRSKRPGRTSAGSRTSGRFRRQRRCARAVAAAGVSRVAASWQRRARHFDRQLE